MSDEVKEYTPEEWETEVKEKLLEYIDNMLKVAQDCNMGTRYFHPVKEVFETHTEYDKSKINGAEIRVVFKFVEDLDKDIINFV